MFRKNNDETKVIFIIKQQRFADIEYIITWGEDGNVYKKLL